MRVNELEKQTLNQLKAGADSCFHDASVNDRDLVNVEHLLKASKIILWRPSALPIRTFKIASDKLPQSLVYMEWHSPHFR